MPSITNETSLQEVRSILDALSPNRSSTTIADNLTLIQSLGHPQYLASLLTQILADASCVTEVARRSYRHVNHFDKLVLADSGFENGYRLTLHLWSPPYTEREVNDELIHDHRFSFWSTVIVGTLISHNFRRSDQGATYRQYQYEPNKDRTATLANFYTFIGDARLNTTSPSRRTAGESYYLSYERIHRVQLPESSMTCTLVLRGPRERPYSNVFNTSYPDTDLLTQNIMFTPAEVSQKLSDILVEVSVAVRRSSA
jgi:hypothetical protein